MPKRSRFERRDLADLLRRRRYVVRSAELTRRGLSRGTISYRTRPGGPWVRLLPGVVQAFTGSPSLVQRALAALLYAGPGALVTGLPLLRLRGFRHLPSSHRLHVLVPHRRKRSSHTFVVVERTRRLPRHEWVHGIAGAPVARAVIDAVRRFDDLDAARALVAEAIQRGFCVVEELIQELAAAHTHGTRLARMALDEVLAGVRSVAEAKARDLFPRAGIPAPLWNHDVFDADGRWLARPDCIWPRLGVVLEIDSMAWHLSPAAYRRTQARQRRLTKYGLLVVPVAPNDLRDQPERVLAEILDTLAAASTRPAPVIAVSATR